MARDGAGGIKEGKWFGVKGLGEAGVILKTKIMDKEAKKEKAGVSNKRGWDALEIKLRERGLTEVEIEEAHDSFDRGIELLAKLFLSYRVREEDKTKGIMKGRINDNSDNR